MTKKKTLAAKESEEKTSAMMEEQPDKNSDKSQVEETPFEALASI